jgi:hypothetical protein
MRIELQADSGYPRAELYKLVAEIRLIFAVALAANATIKSMVKDIQGVAKENFTDNGEPIKFITDDLEYEAEP